MLPYRLRPPVYGTGRLNKNQQRAQPKASLAAETAGATGRDNNAHPYADGGPLQRAIRADLLALRSDFERLMVPPAVPLPEPTGTGSPASGGGDNDDDDDGDGDDGEKGAHQYHHQAAGASFRVFRDQIAGPSKLALLHTRFVPNRVDRGAYSQLVYAACLSLLEDDYSFFAAADEEEDEDFQSSSAANPARVAFAVFCLYSLHETNPLPTGLHRDEDKHESSSLSLLSMGLQDRQNVRVIYRRFFKQKIRIDQKRFAYLLRLRDWSLARCAECQADLVRRGQADLLARRDVTDDERARGSNDDDAHEDDRLRRQGLPNSSFWKCRCSLATDLLSVLDRLWSELDLCAYTGPRGLEGLAGHPEYPYLPVGRSSLVRLTTRAARATNAAAAAAAVSLDPLSPPPRSRVCDDGEEAAAPDDGDADRDRHSGKSTGRLSDMLEDYLSARRAIRGPPAVTGRPSPSQRVRHALSPIFERLHDYGDRPEDALSRLKSAVAADRDDGNGKGKGKGKGKDCVTRMPLRRRREPVVTFASETTIADRHGGVVASGRNGSPDDDEWSRRDDPQERAGTESASAAHGQSRSHLHSYELVLPVDVPAPLRESVRAAVETLLEREGSLLHLMRPTTTMMAAADDGGPPAQQLQQRRDGELSTLGSVSVASAAEATTATTNAGRAALDSLLARAGPVDDRPGKQRQQQQQQQQQRRQRDGESCMLGSASVASTTTTATTNAGRAALDSLLACAGVSEDRPGKHRQQQQPQREDESCTVASGSVASATTKSTTDAGRAVLDSHLACAAGADRPGKHQHQQQKQQRGGEPSTLESASVASATTTNTTNAGRAALDSLLARAEADHELPWKLPVGAARPSGPSREDTPCSESVTDRTDASRKGRAALDDLLASAEKNPEARTHLPSPPSHKSNKRTGDIFLAASEQIEDERSGGAVLKRNNDDLSDLSSEDDDAISVAASAAGQIALDELLLSAEGNKTKKTTPRNVARGGKRGKKRQREGPSSSMPPPRRAKKPGRQRASNFSRSKGQVPRNVEGTDQEGNDGDKGDDDDLGQDHGDESMENQSRGRSSLDFLLEQAVTRQPST